MNIADASYDELVEYVIVVTAIVGGISHLGDGVKSGAVCSALAEIIDSLTERINPVGDEINRRREAAERLTTGAS